MTVSTALAGFVEPVFSTAKDLAKQRVIGWERTTTKVKKSKTETERTAFELQAWEVALLGAVGLAGWWLFIWKGGVVDVPVERPWWKSLPMPWLWPFTKPWESEGELPGWGWWGTRIQP